MSTVLNYDNTLNTFRVTGDDRARLPSVMTNIAGARYVQRDNYWKVPASWQHAKLLRRYIGPDLELDESAEEWVKHFNAYADDFEDAKVGIHADQGPWGQHLFKHQNIGIEICDLAFRYQHWFLLLDVMGLGKSAEAYRAIALADQRGPSMYPFLVVTRSSLKYQMADEHSKWGEGECIVIDGSAPQRKRQIQRAKDYMDQGAKVTVVMNHEAIRLHSRLAKYHGTKNTPSEDANKELNDIEWGTVLVDEAHKCLSPKAKQTRAIWQMGRQARNRIAMTGTPVRDTPGDLWTLFHFCDPQQFPTRTKFMDEWVITAPGFFGGMQTFGLRRDRQDDFNEWFDLCHLRRTKEEVMKDLPEQLPPVYRRVQLSREQRKFYDDLVQFNLAHTFVDPNYDEDINEILTREDDTLSISSMDPLDRHRLLRIAASGLPVLDADGKVHAIDGPSSKFEELLDIWAERDTNTHDPLVVFTTHRRVLRMVERMLAESKLDLRVGAIHGAVPNKARQATVELFQNGGLDILLATLATGGEGVTLTASRRVVLFEPSGSFIMNSQAKDRIHRIGQKRACETIYLVGERTVEEELISSAEIKGFYSEQVLRDKSRQLGIGPDSVYAQSGS